MRDDVVGAGVAAEARLHFRRLAQNVEFTERLVAVRRVRRMEQARTRQFRFEQSDLGAFVECGVVVACAGHRQQLGHHALVHVGILAQIHRRQVVPEYLHGAQQRIQARAREQRRAVGAQRIPDHDKVGAELRGCFVGRADTDFMARRLVSREHSQGRRQSRVDADERAAIGLRLAVFRFVR